MRFLAVIAALALGASALGAQAAQAEDYPSRTVTLIVPFAAGGPTDTIARLTAENMSKALGRQIVVENVTGAGGTLASGRVAKADPDGYTLLIHHIGISTAPALYRKLPFDTRTAFQPIGLVSDAPMSIIARPDFPADTLPELLAKIKADGMKLTYANAGLGAASHLCGTLFMSTIGAQMTTVPYKGNGPILTDLIGKQIDMTCDQTTNTTGPIQAKQVKAYAVTALKRVEQLPDLPTADEAGIKGFQMSAWHAIYAPKGTPDQVVRKLSVALQTALKEPVLVDRFAKIVTTAASQDEATPEALQKKLISEIDRWDPVIKAAGQFAD
jgi:tripartite-type tricarboxylate transporter receptor subunit TctC